MDVSMPMRLGEHFVRPAGGEQRRTVRQRGDFLLPHQRDLGLVGAEEVVLFQQSLRRRLGVLAHHDGQRHLPARSEALLDGQQGLDVQLQVALPPSGDEHEAAEWHLWGSDPFQALDLVPARLSIRIQRRPFRHPRRPAVEGIGSALAQAQEVLGAAEVGLQAAPRAHGV
eukprot:scaffold4508_cov228-Pinguiococcus_pyrenoidosus.AAC.2